MSKQNPRTQSCGLRYEVIISKYYSGPWLVCKLNASCVIISRTNRCIPRRWICHHYLQLWSTRRESSLRASRGGGYKTRQYLVQNRFYHIFFKHTLYAYRVQGNRRPDRYVAFSHIPASVLRNGMWAMLCTVCSPWIPIFGHRNYIPCDRLGSQGSWRWHCGSRRSSHLQFQ